ncbi:MAG TPA: CpsD/CapB family tyrosine-protein kinase [Gammaproteobacteria bacterium]
MSAIELGVVTPLPTKEPGHAEELPNLYRREGDQPPDAIETDKLPTVSLNGALLQENRIILDAQESPAGPSYKVLRTRLLQLMRSNHWSTLAVTSTAPGEGKTVTAINLALSFARDVNTTTVLADFDLRKPSVAKYLGILPDHGLTDVLNDTVPLEQAMVSPGLPRLGLLLNSAPTEGSSELLASPGVAKVVRCLRVGPQRIVVFDMPPLLAGDDVLAFAPHVDALLVVVAEGVTTRETLSAAKELIKGFNVVGTVLNRSSEGSANHYYAYGYS